MGFVIGCLFIATAFWILTRHWRIRIERRATERARVAFEAEWKKRLEHGPTL